MARGRESRRGGIAVAIAAAVLAVVFAAGRVVTGGLGPGPPDCTEPTTWSEAAQYADERVAIAGPVVAVTHVPDVGGEPTFLNLGNPHPDPERFDVVIYADVRAELDAAPEEVFHDHDVCVVGRVRVRNDVPQIILDRPGAIEIAEVQRRSPTP